MTLRREFPMRKTFVLLFALAPWLAPSSASARLHVDLGDPAAHQFTVTYRFVDSDMGSQSMDVLPYEAEIEIVEVVPDKGGRPLEWEPIEGAKKGDPKIRIKYPQTIKPGERFAFRMVAKLTDENAYFEDTAKLNFLYRTGHETSVSLPRAFYPIYSDEAMELIQENERVVLSSKGGKVRPIVIFAVRCGPGGPSRAPDNISTAPEGAGD
ncbi:MAG: hypothetical protein ABIK65_13240 [Candidatus Eisenbacteria bacterium]